MSSKKDSCSLNPSARGHTGGGALSSKIDFPNRKTGKVPQKAFATDDFHGSPSASPDVNASLIMQNMIMNDDDKKYYAMLFKMTHDRFLKNKDKFMESYDEIDEDLLIEPNDVDDLDINNDDAKNEFNAVSSAGIAGYTLPLGLSNLSNKQKNNQQIINKRSFGNANTVKRKKR